LIISALGACPDLFCVSLDGDLLTWVVTVWVCFGQRWVCGCAGCPWGCPGAGSDPCLHARPRQLAPNWERIPGSSAGSWAEGSGGESSASGRGRWGPESEQKCISVGHGGTCCRGSPGHARHRPPQSRHLWAAPQHSQLPACPYQCSGEGTRSSWHRSKSKAFHFNPSDFTFFCE